MRLDLVWNDVNHVKVLQTRPVSMSKYFKIKNNNNNNDERKDVLG